MSGVEGRCMGDDCKHCEELLQPYLDRELTDAERAEAELHLEGCGYCSKRYHFEEDLRRYVRKCCEEPIPEGLKERLRALSSEHL